MLSLFKVFSERLTLKTPKIGGEHCSQNFSE